MKSCFLIYFVFIAIILNAFSETIDFEGYCRSTGSLCRDNNECSDLKCIPFSFYKEICSNDCPVDNNDDNYPKFILPRIDLSIYKHGDEAEIKRLLQQFDTYLHLFGSVSIYNYGIEHSKIDELYEKGIQFFDQSLEYKMKFMTKRVGNSGYDAYKWTAAASSRIDDQPLDLTDAFSRYKFDGENGKYGPINCPKFLLNITDYYIEKMNGIFYNINEIASLSLGLNKNYFNDLHQIDPSNHLRLFHYPSLNISKITNPKTMRVSEHTDFLGFNMFIPGEGRGFQMNINGIWIDTITQNKYDLVLVTGQIDNIWTNNHWKANVHRVIPQNKERLTLSFFTGPDQNTMVEPIKECNKCINSEEPINSFGDPVSAKDFARKTYQTGAKSSPQQIDDAKTFYD